MITNPLFSKPLDIEIHSRSGILIHAETGKILYSKNPHQQMYPASVTKMAFGYYALLKIKNQLDKQLTATAPEIMAISNTRKKSRNYQESPHYLEFNGTHIGIKPGERFSYHFLLSGILIASAADASNLLGKAIDGNLDRCVQNLNRFCLKLGCKNTHFMNLHGLHHPNQVTTVYDMAQVAKSAMKEPLFREIVSKTFLRRPKTHLQKAATYAQSNALLRQGKYYYKYATGIKTGYYDVDTGYCLASSAEKDGRSLIAVTFGASSSKKRFRDHIHLFESAFSEQEMSQKVLSQGKQVFSKTVPHADKILQIVLKEDAIINYYPSEKPEVHAFLEWSSLQLPIAEGKEVGHIIVQVDGKEQIKLPIFSLSTVNKSWLWWSYDQVIEFWWVWILSCILLIIFRKILV